MKLDKYYDQDASKKNEQKHEDAPMPEHHHADTGSGIGKKIDSIVENKYLLLGIAIFIIFINVILRYGLLQFHGLFEPDGFFYYAVIKQAIANHFIVSNYLNISGFPTHNFIGEAQGLPYITVIFYYFLRLFGLTSLTVMRWMPILFGVFDAILAYFLAKYLSNSKVLGLLAMAFVSLSSGNIARTAATVYRGDSFISAFLLLALILMLKCFEERNMILKIVWAVLSAVSLSLGITVWNGAPFIIVVYMLSLLFAIIYGFIKDDKEVLFSGVVLSLTMLISHFLELFYISLGVARAGLLLVSSDFFIFYLPILLGSIATYLIVIKFSKFKLFSTARNRSFATLGTAIIAFIVIFALFGSTVINLASPVSPIIAPTNTTVSNKTSVGNAVTQTTQELQKPSWGFLLSSFNLQLFLSVIGVVIFVLLLFLISKKRIVKEEGMFKLNMIAFLSMLAYFMVTAFLQYSAIRFNAIISMPIAIFSAFAVYGICKLFYHYTVRRKSIAIIVAIGAAITVISLIIYLYPTISTHFVFVSITIILMCIMLGAMFVYVIYGTVKGRLRIQYMILVLVLIIIMYNMYNTYFESYTAAQADGINTQFLQAMTWLKNNTASNATVLALWPDGSVVEGWANRTSYMDSVGGENSSRIFPFARFLFSDNPDTQYLYSIHKPEYLITRNFWYAELGGIAQEGLINNATDYGYVTLQSLNSTSNGTATFFTFSTNNYPYYTSELISIPIANTTAVTYKAYLGVRNSSRLALMRGIIFLNSSNGVYNMFNTGQTNDSANYTLLISFDGRVINGAYILGPRLVTSNVFYFTFLCNKVACPYDNNNVTANEIFQNGDTRIYKLNYLH
jgi:hypothetical protein